MRKEKLEQLLSKYRDQIYPLIPGLKKDDLLEMNFSENAAYLKEVDLKDTRAFHELIFGQILKEKVGIGGFFEDRIIYRRSSHYDGEEARSLHLGLDIWMESGTPLYSPLPGSIHSLQDNQGFGNYGPTIIVEHILEGETFFLLYGHLDTESLQLWNAGDPITAGQLVAHIGDFPENGDWPPHLHWQVMTNMLGHVGDFPGVAAPSKREYYLQFCIDPEYLLKLET